MEFLKTYWSFIALPLGVTIAVLITEPLKLLLRPTYEKWAKAISFARGEVRKKDEIELTLMLRNARKLLQATSGLNEYWLTETSNVAVQLNDSLERNLIGFLKNQTISGYEYRELHKWFAKVFNQRDQMFSVLERMKRSNRSTIEIDGNDKWQFRIMNEVDTMLGDDESIANILLARYEERMLALELIVKGIRQEQKRNRYILKE